MWELYGVDEDDTEAVWDVALRARRRVLRCGHARVHIGRAFDCGTGERRGEAHAAIALQSAL